MPRFHLHYAVADALGDDDVADLVLDTVYEVMLVDNKASYDSLCDQYDIAYIKDLEEFELEPKVLHDPYVFIDHLRCIHAEPICSFCYENERWGYVMSHIEIKSEEEHSALCCLVRRPGLPLNIETELLSTVPQIE